MQQSVKNGGCNRRVPKDHSPVVDDSKFPAVVIIRKTSTAPPRPYTVRVNSKRNLRETFAKTNFKDKSKRKEFELVRLEVG